MLSIRKYIPTSYYIKTLSFIVSLFFSSFKLKNMNVFLHQFWLVAWFLRGGVLGFLLSLVFYKLSFVDSLFYFLKSYYKFYNFVLRELREFLWKRYMWRVKSADMNMVNMIVSHLSLSSSVSSSPLNIRNFIATPAYVKRQMMEVNDYA